MELLRLKRYPGVKSSYQYTSCDYSVSKPHEGLVEGYETSKEAIN